MSTRNSGSKPIPLKFMKHDWFEKKSDEITVHLYVKDVTECDVKFEQDLVIITFSTSNESFLKIHQPQDNDGRNDLFTYSIFTRDKIIPGNSTFSVQKAFIKLSIFKKIPAHWTSLETKISITNRSKLSSDESSLQIDTASNPITTSKSSQVLFDLKNSVGNNKSSSGPQHSNSESENPQRCKAICKTDMLNDNKHLQSNLSGTSLPQNMQLLGGKSTPMLKKQGEQECKTETPSTSNDQQTGAATTVRETEKQKNVNKLVMNKSESVGLTGLENYANNCYMNVVVQALANIREIRDYFLDDQYVHSLSVNNPMSSGGRVTKAFSEVIKALWSDRKTVRPQDLKNIMAKRCSLFMGFQQCDAQEFFATLLDNLHEDLNQGAHHEKMNEATIKDDDGPTPNEKPDTSWDAHMKRNNSMIVKLFHGQLVSKLTCLVCHKKSMTYDPCAQISLPIAMVKHRLRVMVFFKDPSKQPVMTRLQISSPNAQVWHVTNCLEKRLNIPAHCLRIFQFVHGLYVPNFDSNASINAVRSPGVVVACEVRDDKETDLVSLPFIQLRPQPHRITNCGNCKKSQCDLEAKLKRCTGCMHIAYCCKNCQVRHWPTHKKNCRKGFREQIGLPFFVTLKKSILDYGTLSAVAMNYGTFSVEDEGSIQKSNDHSEEERMQMPNIDAATNQLQKLEDEEQADMKSFKNGICSELIKTVENNNKLQAQSDNEREEYNRNTEGATKLGFKATESFLIKAYMKSEQEPIVISDEDFKIDVLLSASYLGLEWQNSNLKEKDVKELTASANVLHDGLLTDDDLKADRCSIEDCLSLFMEPERIPDCWKCSKCKSVQPVKKELALSYPPPVVLFHFKRFAYSACGQKVNKNISYPLSGLDLTHYIAEETRDRIAVNPVYDLTGVICHIGSMGIGHYTCMVQSLGHQAQADLGWRYFDDDLVRKIDEEHVVSPHAYVLVYRMRDIGHAMNLETPFPLALNDIKQEKMPGTNRRVDWQLSAGNVTRERLKSAGSCRINASETAVQPSIRRSTSVEVLQGRKSTDHLIVSSEASIDKKTFSNHAPIYGLGEDLCTGFSKRSHENVFDTSVGSDHHLIDNIVKEKKNDVGNSLSQMSITNQFDSSRQNIEGRGLSKMDLPEHVRNDDFKNLDSSDSFAEAELYQKQPVNEKGTVGINKTAEEHGLNVFDNIQDDISSYQPLHDRDRNVNEITEDELD